MSLKDDPLRKILKMPFKKMQEINEQHYHGHPAIIPRMEPALEHACLSEIRLMKHNLTPWKKMPNGMSAGQFAFLYVHHFKNRRLQKSVK